MLASDRSLRQVPTPAIAGAIWAAVWLVLRLTGQEYSLRPLYAGYQFVPLDDLVRDPFGSVWNLHIQPPLWNLYAGVAGAWSPLGQSPTHQLVSLATGVVLAAAVCATLVHLGAPRRWALGLTAVATCNAQVMQHAFEPRYDFAVAALLTVLVWSVARARHAEARWMFAAPVIVATTVVSIRALYHPIWLVGVVAVASWAFGRRVPRREVTAALAVAVVLVGGWVAKNAVQVDRPTMSTWTGLNLLRSVSPAADRADLDRLVAGGDITDMAIVGVAAHALAEDCDVPGSGHPVVSAPTKFLPPEYQRTIFDDDTVPNYNAACFLDAYDQARDDAWTIAGRHPEAWVRARLWSLNNWFELPSDVTTDTSPLWRPLEVVTRVALLGAPHPGLPGAWSDASLWVRRLPQSLLLVAGTVALLRAAVMGWAAARRENRSDLWAVLAGWIVAWTFLTGVVAELGEQARFRNATDPIVIAFGTWMLVEWYRSRRTPTTDPTDGQAGDLAGETAHEVAGETIGETDA